MLSARNARNRDRITIYEHDLTNAVEANPVNAWLVGHRKVLDTFRLDPSLNLIFRQYVPAGNVSDAMLEAARPYEGERRITEESDFSLLNYDTVKGFYEALRSGVVKRTLADTLKTCRDICCRAQRLAHA
jgi:hypothetical protein